MKPATPIVLGVLTCAVLPAKILAAEANTVQELVVTAQKREERLQDVPVSVAVVNTESLSQNEQPKLRDFFATVPGLSVSPSTSGGNQQAVIIRGISSGAFGNPTVGVTVDDVPYGSFIREFTPDIDPSDLSRIEVLRGPQGTLYGASSMGGLIKFVTVDPSPKGMFGRLQADLNTVQNGAQVGYGLRGAINVPLSSDVALRASAFSRQDAGYIDNPVLGLKGVNEDHDNGGRLSLFWQVSDTSTLKLSALYQRTTGHGNNDVDVLPGLSGLEQNYIRGVGAYTKEIQAYSAIFNGRFGIADVTSVTGYNINKNRDTIDLSSSFGSSAQRFFGVSGASELTDESANKISQELRASAPLGKHLELMVGGFYTHEHIPYTQYVTAQDPPTGRIAGPVGGLILLDEPTDHTEYAAFGDLTLHFTDRIDLQLGGRESRLNDTFDQVTETGTLIGATPKIFPAIRRDANVFTYLVSPRFRISDDLMIYGRVASGYRPSRSNLFNPDPAIPRTAGPDSTVNYEIGAKGDLLDHVLSFEAAVYYIDFRNIQISLTDPTNKLGYFDNGSGAKSQGAELSLQAHPTPSLTVTAAGAYDNAVLTSSFPANTAAFGITGNRLPFSPRVSASLSVEEQRPISDGVVGIGGVTLSYVGDRIGPFVTTSVRQVYPAYAKLDLHVGANFKDWVVNVYANNVTDKRGLIGGGIGNGTPFAFVFIQPRTVGVSVTRTF
jgi:outer membrane receptor protein involved in Fe transport